LDWLIKSSFRASRGLSPFAGCRPGLLVAAWVATAVFDLPLPAAPLYVIGVAILAYNAVFTFVLRRLLRTQPPNIIWFHRLTKIQIALDWLR